MENGLPGARKRVIRAREVTVAKEVAKIPVRQVRRAPSSEPPPSGEPEINLERADDGTILAIDIRCACGRVITLRCEYLEQGGENEQADS